MYGGNELRQLAEGAYQWFSIFYTINSSSGHGFAGLMIYFAIFSKDVGLRLFNVCQKVSKIDTQNLLEINEKLPFETPNGTFSNPFDLSHVSIWKRAH